MEIRSTIEAIEKFKPDLALLDGSIIPHYIPRPDNPILMEYYTNLIETYKSLFELTTKKKIILAGLWTCACVSFPTFDMLAEGYEIYVPTDACGDTSVEAHERAVARLEQAGAVPMTALQTVFELQQDWARGETYDGVMDILYRHSPYGIQVHFSKWALGEHASEAGNVED